MNTYSPKGYKYYLDARDLHQNGNSKVWQHWYHYYHSGSNGNCPSPPPTSRQRFSNLWSQEQREGDNIRETPFSNRTVVTITILQVFWINHNICWNWQWKTKINVWSYCIINKYLGIYFSSFLQLSYYKDPKLGLKEKSGGKAVYSLLMLCLC